ncbi:MAG: hypothetical protein IJD95_04435 [Clostridia bacterium]|nr:hypothetical protein [Clostridia bacterium]
MNNGEDIFNENEGLLEKGFSNELPDIVDDTTVKKNRLSVVKKVRLLTAAIIILLVTILLFVYGSSLNYDNIRRFFVKVSYNFNTEIAPRGSFEFDESDNMRYVGYKNGVAVLSGGTLSVFDDRGYLLSSKSAVYKTPMLTTSGKYLISYDLGGTSLSVHNSFDTVFNYTSDMPITYASMGKGNHLAVCSYAEDHKNKITVFDTTFSPIFTVYRYDRYVTAAETSPDNKMLAVAAVYPSGAEMYGEIILYRYGESESYATCKLSEEYPHTVFYKKDGTLCAITEKSVFFIDKSGTVLSKYSFDGKDICCIANDLRYTAIAVTTAGVGSVEITVFDSNGNVTATQKGDIPTEMTFGNNCLWALYENGYSSYDLKSGEKKTYPITERKAILFGKNSVILLTDGHGEIIVKE